MSSTSVSPEIANVAAAQVSTQGTQSSASPQKVAAENPVPEVQAAASLKESIRSVAETADSEREHTLRSITNVADDIEEAETLVEWWMSIEETPPPFLELAMTILHHFPDDSEARSRSPISIKY